MPAEGCVPLPPGSAELIVTAKAGKTFWALEEVADTVIPLDPDAEVARTAYEGVIMVRVGVDVREVVKTIKRFEYAFISFITPVIVRCVGASRGEVLEAVRSLVGRTVGVAAQAALRVRLRGSSKNVLAERDVEEAVKSLGVRLTGRSDRIVVVEGIDDYVGLSYGNTRSCGVGCVLVDLAELTLI